MLYKYILFVALPYICSASFIFGSFYKISALFNKKAVNNKPDILMSGVLTLILFHVGVYFAVKLLFVLTNLSYESLNSTFKVIQAIATIFILTAVTVIVFYKKIRYSNKVFSNFYNNAITAIIILHIAFGYFSIMLVGGSSSAVEKKLAFAGYFKGLAAFNLQSASYLTSLHYTSYVHLILGFLFLAFLPYSTIFDGIYIKACKACRFVFK